MVAIKVKSTNVLTGEHVDKEGVKFSSVLFSEDYEILREELSLATIIMWITFILVVLSVVVSAFAFFIKSGVKMSKFGGVLLVVAMVLLFVVNVDKVTLDVYVAKGETSITNMTVLYFTALVISIGSSISVNILKK